MSQRQFNLFFLVDVGVTDGLVVEDLESLATVVKISCLKILSHFHGKGGVGWQYKLARLSQNSASQMDNSPNSFYRFRSFKLGEFERFEVALDSAINSTTVVQKLAAAGANNCLSVVKKLNRLLVELISCDWSVINVSSPVKQSRAYGRVSQEVQQQTEERNNFVFIISSSLQLTGDSHSSIIDPATMANLCDQYKVATFVLDISSYLNREEELSVDHSEFLHESLAKTGGGLIPVSAILQDFLSANNHRDGLCLSPSLNGYNIFAGRCYLPNSTVLSCLFRNNCDRKLKTEEKEERRLFTIYTHYAGSKLKIATMWSSPVLTGANGDENGDYRHISEAIICGTVAAHLLPSFSKQNLMMLDAHEETNGFKSTLLKARNKNVSLILCCKSERNDQLPNFGILKPLSEDSALLNILTRRSELGWYKQLEFVGKDGEPKASNEADLNSFVQKTVTHFAQNYRQNLHSPIKDRKTSESESDSETEVMPTAIGMTETWYRDGVSSAVKNFFQKQKEKMKLSAQNQSTEELKVLDQLEMLYARKLSAIASRQRQHKNSSDGVSSTASTSYSHVASERTRKLMRHASVNHKLFRSSSQTSVKSSAEEDGGETAKKKRRKSVLERRAHSRRQRLDGLMSQLELVTIANADEVKQKIEETIVSSLNTGRSAMEIFLSVRESLKSFGRSQTWSDNIDLFVHEMVQRDLLKSPSQIADECQSRNDSAKFKLELLKLQSLIHLFCMKDPENMSDIEEVNLEPVVSFVRSLSFVGGTKLARSFLEEDVIDTFVHCIPMSIAAIYQQLEQPVPVELENYAIESRSEDEEEMELELLTQSPSLSDVSRSATPILEGKCQNSTNNQGSALNNSNNTSTRGLTRRSSAIFNTSSHRQVAVCLPAKPVMIKQKSEPVKAVIITEEKSRDADKPKRDKKLKTKTVADTPCHKQMPRSAYLRQKHSAKCRKLLIVKESPVKRLTASSSHDLRKSPRARPPQSYTSAFRPASVNSLASTSKESDQLSLAEPFVSPIKITRQSAKEFLFKDVLTESPVQLTTPCKDGPSPKRLKIVFRLSSTKKPANEAVWHRTPLKSTGKKEKNNGQLHSTGKRSPVEAVVEVPRVPVRKNLSSCFSSPKKPTTSESGTIVSSPLKRSLRSDSRAIAAEIPVSTVSYQLPKESAESYRKYVEHLQMEKIGNGEEEVFYGRGTLRYSVFHGEYSGVYDDTNKQKKSKLNADDSVDHMASYLLNVYNPQPLNPVRFDKFKSPIKASRFGSRRSRLRSPQKVQDCQQHQLESPGSPTIKLINIATFFKTEKTTDSHTNCLSERKLSLRMSPDMLQPKSPKSSREHSYNCRSKGKVSIDIDESDEEEFT